MIAVIVVYVKEDMGKCTSSEAVGILTARSEKGLHAVEAAALHQNLVFDKTFGIDIPYALRPAVHGRYEHGGVVRGRNRTLGGIAQAAGDRGKSDEALRALEAMEDQEWCWAVTLGDIYTQRQDYDKAIAWYRRGQELQPSPKFTDSAMSIAHICEILGDKEGAVSAYREVLRLQREEWGIVSGEERDEVEWAIQRLQE